MGVAPTLDRGSGQPAEMGPQGPIERGRRATRLAANHGPAEANTHLDERRATDSRQECWSSSSHGLTRTASTILSCHTVGSGPDTPSRGASTPPWKETRRLGQEPLR